eukprot:2992026-Amphidinium_carterae.2
MFYGTIAILAQVGTGIRNLSCAVAISLQSCAIHGPNCEQGGQFWPTSAKGCKGKGRLRLLVEEYHSRFPQVLQRHCRALSCLMDSEALLPLPTPILGSQSQCSLLH